MSTHVFHMKLKPIIIISIYKDIEQEKNDSIYKVTREERL